MNFLKNNVVALVAVIIALVSLMGYHLGGSQGFGSTACSGITCLSGGLRLVSDAGGDFESDVAALFASTVGITGNTTVAGNLAVATTSVSRIVNIGAGGSATSTIDAGKPCFRFTMLLGQVPTVVYYWPSNVITGSGNVSGWATSTVSCF